MRRFHLFFEQSGTFKNELKKLGYEAYDYDILDDFGETDFVADLFATIEISHGGGRTFIDDITSEDTIIAFFPCTRFEQQVLLSFRGDNAGFKNWSELSKMEYDLKLQDELSRNYSVLTKLVIICLRRNIPLIIENPYSTQHYLQKYWAIKPKVIDENRRNRGDYYVKPTQYWFINCEPKNNLILEDYYPKPKKVVSKENKVERSMISKQYANRFLREFVLED